MSEWEIMTVEKMVDVRYWRDAALGVVHVTLFFITQWKTTVATICLRVTVKRRKRRIQRRKRRNPQRRNLLFRFVEATRQQKKKKRKLHVKSSSAVNVFYARLVLSWLTMPGSPALKPL